MKVLVLSDLHIEFENFDIDCTGVDLVILAGDIHTKDRGFLWALESIKDIPVVYVLGNHEYYRKAYPKLVNDLKQQSLGANIHVLENDVFTFNDVNFLGCTLWTDFNLFDDPKMTGFECEQRMTDFSKIRVSPRFSKLRPPDVVKIHNQSLSWLESELGKRQNEINVVITHHTPCMLSVPEQYKADVVTAAYASNLDDFVRKYSPKYWIHGHMHNSSDYMLGNTRVICNPRGYPDERNLEFNPYYIIDV